MNKTHGTFSLDTPGFTVFGPINTCINEVVEILQREYRSRVAGFPHFFNVLSIPPFDLTLLLGCEEGALKERKRACLKPFLGKFSAPNHHSLIKSEDIIHGAKGGFTNTSRFMDLFIKFINL